MSIRKHNAKAGVWAIRLLSITLSVMLIVTMIPSSGIGRVYAEPKTNDAQGSPAFSQQMEVDGILVGVEAPDGLLPADAMLAVSEITDEELLAKAEEAVGEQREQGTTPDVSRVFDVKILDSQGNELQPAEGQGLITVSFSKAGDQEADTMVYQLLHEPSSEPDWIARKCDATWNPSTNMYEVDADSFSPFVLESMGQSLKDSKAAPLRGSGTEADLFSAYWDGERYVLPSGTYKMTEDFTAQGFIFVAKDETVTIDLNGCTLKRELESSTAKGYIIENAGTLTIQDSSSEATGKITGGNNGRTSNSGGGIYNVGTFNLEGGSITGNKAQMFGGGIYNGGAGTVNITGGSITNNTTQKGGGIYNSGTVNISDAVISGNVATADRGGGIYNSNNLKINGNTVIENNRITHADAIKQGGGIYTERNITMSGTPVIRNNTPMDLFLTGNNVVKVDGTFGTGTAIGVLAATPYRKITSGFKSSGNSSEAIQNMFFTEEGYALKESGGEVYISETGTEISSWAALQQAVNQAADNTKTVLTLSGDVTAAGNEGRIQIPKNKEILLDLAGHKLNRDRLNSSSNRYGQVIGVYGKLTIVDSSGNDSGQITGGNAERGGGINIDDTGECELRGGSIKDNKASGNGGGVYVYGTFRMSGGHVSSNDATGSDSDGGGIFVDGDHKAVLDITGGHIDSNMVWADGDEGRAGGAINIQAGATANISNATLNSNLARMGGGAIYTQESVTISNCSFRGNSSSALLGERKPYGTIYPYKDYALYYLNQTYDGGAISVAKSAEVTIDQSTFDDNYVRNCALTNGGHGKGGAICLKDRAKLNIRNSSFSGNVSWDGGAIYTNTNTTLSVENTKFERNHVGTTNDYSYDEAMPTTDRRISSGGGGGITSYGTLTLEGCTFTGNYLTNDMDSAKGGAIYSKGSLTMKDVTCTGNKGRLGGGLYKSSGQATLTDCTIRNNQSTITGGGVYVDTGDFVTKGKTIINDNQSSGGNDVYLPSGKYIKLTEPLKYGADIGVSLENKYGRFSTNFSTYHSDVVPETYFYSAGGYEVILRDNEGYINAIELDDEHKFIKWRDQIKSNKNRLSGPNWMAGISGERYLNEINIPGTHDSSMYGPDDTGAPLGNVGASFAQTQLAYIDQQLEDGMRMLDLRLIHEIPKTNFPLGIFAPWVSGTVAGTVALFLLHFGTGGLVVGTLVGIVAGMATVYVNPQVCTFKDDGKNLYTCHGKTGVGRFYALNKDDEYLSLAEELTWMKNFLKEHPTETIIVNVAAEVKDGDESGRKIVMSRLRNIITDLSAETNPSTGESYVYWEKDSSGRDKICEPLTHYPQLKDCRGKLVFGGQVKDIGGFETIMDGTTVERPEGGFTDNAGKKVNNLRKWFDTHNTLRIPKNAEGERSKTAYSVGTNGTDEIGLQTPIDVAKAVLPRVFPEMIGEDQCGQYLGFISMDGARQSQAFSVWTTNFFEGLDYCTVTVKAGSGSFDSGKPDDQTYQLLRGTKIKIPGCIYDGAQADKFKGWQDSTDGSIYNLNDEYTIKKNVTFTAQWAGTVQTPVTVVWKDADDLEEMRPDNLRIMYTDADNTGHEKTVTAGDNWTTILSGELKTAPQPQTLAGYTANVTGSQGKTGYTITMTHNPGDEVNASGKVTWDDKDDLDGIRPDSVTVKLFADGREIESTKITAENGWEYSFGKKPQYVDGKKVEYWIQEDEIPVPEDIGGYSIGIDGFNIINTHNVEMTVAACVIEWDDDYNSQGLRPDSVTIHWMVNGEQRGADQVIKENDEGEWAGSLELTRAEMRELSGKAEAVIQKYNDLAKQNADGKLTEAQQEEMEKELKEVSEIAVTQDAIGNGYETEITIEPVEVSAKPSEDVDEDVEYKSLYFKVRNTLHPKHEHDMEKTEAKPATCTKEGNTAYWTCKICSHFFSDEEGKKEIKMGSWIIPATGHKLKKTEAKKETCTEAGNTEYWKCETCSRFFGDEEGSNEIDEDSWIIKATGHDWGEWTEAGSKQHQKVCANDSSHVQKEDHVWDAGQVTKEATYTEAGSRICTCTVCGATETVSIPKLKDALAVGMKAKGKKSLVITWSRVEGAEGYDVFFGKCANESNKNLKKKKTLKGNEKISWTVKGLKKHKPYKACVKAWKMKDGKKTYIKTSLTFHAFTAGYSKKYTNPKSVKVNRKSVTLKVGKTFRIKAKVTKLKKKKKLISKKHAPKLRYQSTDKKVATVSKTGKIKAIAKGKCKIYVYAASGVHKTVSVTVE